MHHHVFYLAFGFFAAGIPAATLAQPEHLTPLIELLDSDSYLERESASLRIPRIHGLSLRDIEKYLESSMLGTEQRLRLERVAESLFASTPRAGLGVQFGVVTQNTVSLAGVVEGDMFPANKILKAGDIFIEIDGHTQISQQWLKAWIVSHAPGESLHIKLKRDEQALEFDVPLGSFGDLGNASLDQASISQAYKLRQSRLHPATDSELQLGQEITATQWVQAAYPDASYEASTRPIAILSGHWVAGSSQALNRAHGWVSRSLHLLHPLSLTGLGFPEILPTDLRQDFRTVLQRQAESLERRADNLQALIKQREYTPDEIENIESQIRIARDQAQATQLQISALDAIPITPAH